MNYFFDLDETLCTSTQGRYAEAQPKQRRIDHVNALYDEGHHITIWTARGATTGIDHTELTTGQLKAWGVKHHAIMMGKPNYDVFVCDKAKSDVEFFGPEPVDLYDRKLKNGRTMCAYTGHAYDCNYHLNACDCQGEIFWEEKNNA